MGCIIMYLSVSRAVHHDMGCIIMYLSVSRAVHHDMGCIIMYLSVSRAVHHDMGCIIMYLSVSRAVHHDMGLHHNVSLCIKSSASWYGLHHNVSLCIKSSASWYGLYHNVSPWSLDSSESGRTQNSWVSKHVFQPLSYWWNCSKNKRSLNLIAQLFIIHLCVQPDCPIITNHSYIRHCQYLPQKGYRRQFNTCFPRTRDLWTWSPDSSAIHLTYVCSTWLPNNNQPQLHTASSIFAPKGYRRQFPNIMHQSWQLSLFIYQYLCPLRRDINSNARMHTHLYIG